MIDTSTIPSNVRITPANMGETLVDGGYYYICFNKNSKKAYLSSDGIYTRKNGKTKPGTVVKIVMDNVREPAIPELFRLKKVRGRYALINANTNGVLTYDAGLDADIIAGKLDMDTYQPYYLVDDTGQYTAAQLFDLDSTSIPESVYAVNTYAKDVNDGYRIYTRVYNIPVNISAKYKVSTICLPCGARVPDEQVGDFKIYMYKMMNGKVHAVDIAKNGIPRNTGCQIEYVGTSVTSGSVTLKLLIDDSVGSPLTDNLFISSPAARDGFEPETTYALSVNTETDKAEWIISTMTHVMANKAFLPVYYNGEKIKGQSISFKIDKSLYPGCGGQTSNTLLRCSGCVIPVEDLVEKAVDADEKQKIVNYASWYVGRAIDNQSFLTDLAGRKKKDGTDGDLITSLKNMVK